jgi:phosphate/sulfate permease
MLFSVCRLKSVSTTHTITDQSLELVLLKESLQCVGNDRKFVMAWVLTIPISAILQQLYIYFFSIFI